MMKTKRYKMLALTVLFVVPLMLVTANSVFSGPNPGTPADMRLQGPAIVGEITIYPPELGEEGQCGEEYCCDDIPASFPCVYAMFDGKCKNIAINFVKMGWPAEVAFSDLGPENLEGWVIEVGVSTYDCYPDSTQLIINTVTNFAPVYVGGELDRIVARVVMLYLVAK